MSANSPDVLVFRTNVRSVQDLRKLKPLLDRLLHDQGKWNFDLEDCDSILRVEIPGLLPEVIAWHVRDAGFVCDELEDIIYPPGKNLIQETEKEGVLVFSETVVVS